MTIKICNDKKILLEFSNILKLAITNSIRKGHS